MDVFLTKDDNSLSSCCSLNCVFLVISLAYILRQYRVKRTILKLCGGTGKSGWAEQGKEEEWAKESFVKGSHLGLSS